MRHAPITALALDPPRADQPELLRLRDLTRPSQPPWALFWQGNLLAPDCVNRAYDAMRAAAEAGARRLICFSGSLGADLDDAASANWLGPGMEALQAALANLAPELRRRSLSLLIQPHARHVASDIPSSRLLAAGDTDSQARLALNPAALLEASMRPDAADHLERILEALLPFADCIILTNVELPDEAGEAALAPAPVTTGAIATGDLLAIVGGALSPLDAPPPVALLDRDLDAQLEALKTAGYTPA